MVYSKFASFELRPFIRFLSLFLAAAITLTTTSCETVTVKDYTPEQFEVLEDPADQTVIVLAAQDTTFNTAGCNVVYVKGIKDAPTRFRFEIIYSIPAKDISAKAFRLEKKLFEINLYDLKYIRTIDSKLDMGKTLKWTGITIGIIVVLGVIYYIISPPKINSGLGT